MPQEGGGGGECQWTVVSGQWSVVRKSARGCGCWSCFDCAPGWRNYLQELAVGQTRLRDGGRSGPKGPFSLRRFQRAEAPPAPSVIFGLESLEQG